MTDTSIVVVDPTEELQSVARQLAIALEEKAEADAAFAEVEYIFRQQNAEIIKRRDDARAAARSLDSKAREMVESEDILLATGGKGIEGISVRYNWHLVYDADELLIAAMFHAPELLTLCNASAIKAYMETYTFNGIDAETGESGKFINANMAERLNIRWERRPTAVISDKTLLTALFEQAYKNAHQ